MINPIFNRETLLDNLTQSASETKRNADKALAERDVRIRTLQAELEESQQEAERILFSIEDDSNPVYLRKLSDRYFTEKDFKFIS